MSSSNPQMASTNNQVIHQFAFFRVYDDGRIDFSHPPCEKIPPQDDPLTGLQSKDVTISKEPQVSARIFLPKLQYPNQKLPVLVYVHGGGFCALSAFFPAYHKFCAEVAADAEAIVVSVEYGLFPARPIPACYDDSWAALQWVAGHVGNSGPDPWLNEHADFGRVFVGGDSAGGNISHTLAFRVGSIGLPAGVKLVGAILVHPFFGGTKDDDMWLYMCRGNSGGIGDPRMNPPLEDLARLGCERVLVFVAGKDHLNVVGKSYFERLKRSGWKGSAELVENENLEHCFHFSRPEEEAAVGLRQKFVSFIKKE